MLDYLSAHALGGSVARLAIDAGINLMSVGPDNLLPEGLLSELTELDLLVTGILLSLTI